MATYTSTRDGGGVQERVASQGNCDGKRGIRRKWWWESGPVDSFYYFYSLRTGVAVLAMTDFLLNGIWSLFFLRKFYSRAMEAILGFIQGAYTVICQAGAGRRQDCEALGSSIKQLQDCVKLMQHLPPTFSAHCALCMIAGAVGLWAVFGGSALAAKLYMYSWPAKFLLGTVSACFLDDVIIQYSHDVKIITHVVLAVLLNIISFVYNFKVCWSYHETLKTQSNKDTTAESGWILVSRPE